MKTIVEHNTSVGYIDQYVYDSTFRETRAIVVFPNINKIKSLSIKDAFNVLPLDIQKEFNKLFFG